MKKFISLLLTLCMIFGCMTTCFASEKTEPTFKEFALQYANELKDMGLFLGVSDTDFALEQRPTRAQGIVMLVRLLGKADEAKAGNYTHPFTDVPDWADDAVGYAYQAGLTNGVSATKFGSNDYINVEQYGAFIMRALGYTDGVDFLWNDNVTKNGLELRYWTPEMHYGDATLRQDIAVMSYMALSIPMKNSMKTLAESLRDSGTITDEQLTKYIFANRTAEYELASDNKTYKIEYIGNYEYRITRIDGKAIWASGYSIDGDWWVRCKNTINDMDVELGGNNLGFFKVNSNMMILDLKRVVIDSEVLDTMVAAYKDNLTLIFPILDSTAEAVEQTNYEYVFKGVK